MAQQLMIITWYVLRFFFSASVGPCSVLQIRARSSTCRSFFDHDNDCVYATEHNRSLLVTMSSAHIYGVSVLCRPNVHDRFAALAVTTSPQYPPCLVQRLASQAALFTWPAIFFIQLDICVCLLNGCTQSAACHSNVGCCRYADYSPTYCKQKQPHRYNLQPILNFAMFSTQASHSQSQKLAYDPQTQSMLDVAICVHVQSNAGPTVHRTYHYQCNENAAMVSSISLVHVRPAILHQNDAQTLIRSLKAELESLRLLLFHPRQLDRLVSTLAPTMQSGCNPPLTGIAQPCMTYTWQRYFVR